MSAAISQSRKFWTIEEIKRANAEAGRHFFEPGALRFFRSRILSTVYQGPGGVYFVTSEQFRSRETVGKRAYTVREFNPETGDVSTLGTFQEYAKAEHARLAATRLSEG